MIYGRFVKRALDVVLSAAALAVLWPLMLLAALAIYAEDRGPILFRQARVGRGQSTFQVMKFRSMRVGTANLPSADADDRAITRMGAVLRRTNLDELPQLINIVRGDMSVVGPRPAVPSQTSLIALRESGGAHRLRPGLTGLAQINSYDGMPDEDKARYDVLYASRVSLGRDLAIIARTIGYLRKPPPKY